MADSFSKNFKKKFKNKRKSTAPLKSVKANNNKGKELEDMFSYVDGVRKITTPPPEKEQKFL